MNNALGALKASEGELWQFLKAFAGPIAIIIASATAAWMTNKFGTIQAGIAREQAKTAEAQKDISKSQRDIAYDRLKHDLFEKRYEVYSAAKSLIEEIFAKSPVDEANPEINSRHRLGGLECSLSGQELTHAPMQNRVDLIRDGEALRIVAHWS